MRLLTTKRAMARTIEQLTAEVTRLNDAVYVSDEVRADADRYRRLTADVEAENDAVKKERMNEGLVVSRDELVANRRKAQATAVLVPGAAAGFANGGNLLPPLVPVRRPGRR